VKERLAAEAGGDSRRFLDQMEAWTVEHPHTGPVVDSPEELQARLRAREATEPPPPGSSRIGSMIRSSPSLHRTREKLHREQQAEALI